MFLAEDDRRCKYQEELTKRIQGIAKRVQQDFDRLVHDESWTVRCIVGQRIGGALASGPDIVLADDNEGLIEAIRPHTTDDPA